MIKKTLLALFLFYSVACAETVVSSEVIVFDDIVSIKKSIKLRALTKGRFFPDGGRLVQFHIDGEHIGSNLSGGDGYAFLKYQASSPGIKNIAVMSGNDKGEGTLLITLSRDKVILIAVEKTLIEFPISLKPAKEAVDTLTELSEDFRIVFLTTLAGTQMSRKWLGENEFPPAPVLKWRGPAMLTVLRERGVVIHAAVGPPKLLAEMSDVKKRFSFEETEEGTMVKNWQDLPSRLNSAGDK